MSDSPDGRGTRNTAAGPASASQSDDDGRSFEDLMNELEQVTEQLAGGELGIEAAADLYERAQHLHSLAAQRLAQVQERIDRLSTPG